jgi:GT2 family glycosyltransferase
MAIADQPIARITAAAPRNGAALPAPRRVRADGKFFARGANRLRIRGVTYGPFAANPAGEPFPSPGRVAGDFARMRAAGANALRTYHLPPAWLLDLADEGGMALLVEVPWAKHLCFLDSAQARRDARQAVREAALHGHSHGCVLAYGVGNEIPPSIVRWFGARRVERFLAELADVARQADPAGLVTYANYPPTEYLDLSFLDVVTFNVYLHDREAFRRYLLRLQHLVGDRPLLLGELGMDTLRHGEAEQADFLAGHVREALLSGLAGAFVFSWTDDWFTGGHAVLDWAFGITDADRSPKASYHALRVVFQQSAAGLLAEAPRVSVVVCTYNGGATLEQCLRSLLALDYPDYEVIVVDDGSTDDTRAILSRYPQVRAIHQENQGLSAARNVGLREATGAVVAYTDSDCFADRDWLTHLVHRLWQSDAAAVGGPNLTPEDGWLAACVAAAPGQPMHVLESDQVAEHVPGCNMAFRREALLAINGFDCQFRKAGDDVDVCWRLQQAGLWITFAPGAFVWHHRRQNPRAYLRQQAGYGEAEALLQYKHPDRFNDRGDGKWRGVLYGVSLQGLQLGKPLIYRGTFGTGLFQSIYQPGPAHWAMLPGTLEWHLVAALVALAAVVWEPGRLLAPAMLGMSMVVAALHAWQARVPSRHDGLLARLLILVLCYAQPLVRSCMRYRTRLFAYCPPRPAPVAAQGAVKCFSFSRSQAGAYWSAAGLERTDLVGLFLAYLLEHRWGTTVDSGWSDWDLQVHPHPWTRVQICTAQEDHGGRRHLIRVRYRLRWTSFARAVAASGIAVTAVAVRIDAWSAVACAGLVGALLLGAWWQGTRLAGRMIQGLDGLARSLDLVPCPPPSRREDGRARASGGG